MYEYLDHAISKPDTLGDLKVGDKFIFFPCDDDGDDHHGGFKGRHTVFEKIEPFWPGEPYHKDYLYCYKEVEHGHNCMGYLTSKVIKLRCNHTFFAKQIDEAKIEAVLPEKASPLLKAFLDRKLELLLADIQIFNGMVDRWKQMQIKHCCTRPSCARCDMMRRIQGAINTGAIT